MKTATPTESSITIAVRVSPAVAAKVDHIKSKASSKAGFEVCKSTVMRAAFCRGLDAFEAELGAGDTPPPPRAA